MLSGCRFSVIDIDADWDQSTMDVLIHIYPRLTIGGFVIIDNYKLLCCRKVVGAFRV
ncbi:MULTISPECIES: TylF/MycF/NovP-related O-methyltransferase [unclassified Bartonella]|uniref:TylF/MycF/NovP-related O-methyltransferase n=1 Tax=unclassified Bartonella TaxID=2645622 RepID=UPI0035CF3747